MRILFGIFLLGYFVLSHAAFVSHISTLDLDKQHYTWRSGCPVSLRDLREVKLSFWGFDHQEHQGVLIVNKKIANEIVTIFHALYQHHFPIQRMESMEVFKGDDNAAMEANNTSAFNCRWVANQPGIYSPHSAGMAIDINTLINPYVNNHTVLPANGKTFVARDQSPGKITRDSFIYSVFTQHGWQWGGDWKKIKDYQHFEKKY